MNAVKRFSVPLIDHQSIKELISDIKKNRSGYSLLFLSPSTDLDYFTQSLIEADLHNNVCACTTAGEIGTDGYLDNGISGITFFQNEYISETFLIDNASSFNAEEASKISDQVNKYISKNASTGPGLKFFGIILLDGLSVCEEKIVGQLSPFLHKLPIVGGSAGDGLRFQKTQLLYNGKLKSNAGALIVFGTHRPFDCFKTQHFIPSEDKMVITAADPAKRIVYEINGETAAPEYAKILGIKTDKLEPMIFANYPLCARLGGDYYVRSIQKVNEDNSLSFYCAIDEGIVLTLSQGLDIVPHTSEILKQSEEKVGTAQAIIAFECILRRLEVLQKDLRPEIDEIYKKFKIIGFHTYGEQFGAIHINQTLSGITLG